MQPTRTPPKKAPKFLDTKVFIATLSVAVTIGLWNLLSNAALHDVVAAQNKVQAAPAESSVAAGQGLPPLPTLIPLVDVPVIQQNAALPAGQAQPNNLQLRAVTAQDQVIVQKVKPVFDQPGAVVVTVGGGGGGSSSGGGSSAPVARSSK